MEIKADIIDYMGRIRDGVLVLLSVTCDGKYSEATIFYNDKDILLTVDRSVEEAVAGPIEAWPGYKDLLTSILARLVPASEVVGRLDEVDFGRFVEQEEGEFVEEDEDYYDEDYEEDEEDDET